jgi:hypothetical protein
MKIKSLNRIDSFLTSLITQHGDIADTIFRKKILLIGFLNIIVFVSLLYLLFWDGFSGTPLFALGFVLLGYTSIFIFLLIKLKHGLNWLITLADSVSVLWAFAAIIRLGALQKAADCF